MDPLMKKKRYAVPRIGKRSPQRVFSRVTLLYRWYRCEQSGVTANVQVDPTTGELLFKSSRPRGTKKNIKPMDKASEAIFALKPVTFRYKKKLNAKGNPAVWISGRRSRKGES